MAKWIRKEEYEHLKNCLDAGWQAKDLASQKGRGITTIYQIKNTNSHEDYCKKHNIRQWKSTYATDIFGEFAPNLGHDPHNPWPLKGETGSLYAVTYADDWVKIVEERLTTLTRKVNALEYLGRKK